MPEVINIPIEFGLPQDPLYDHWDKFMFDLMKDFAQGLTAHDRKVENEILNFVYSQIQSLQNNLLAPINAAAMYAHDAAMALANGNGVTKDNIDSLYNKIKQELDNQTSFSYSWLSDIVRSLANSDAHLTNSTNEIQLEIDSRSTVLQDTLKESVNNINDTVKDGLSKTKDSLTSEIQFSSASIESNLSSTKNSINNNIDNSLLTTKRYLDAQTNTLNESISKLSTTVMSTRNDFKDALEYIWGIVKQWIEADKNLNVSNLINNYDTLMQVQKSIAQHLQG
jgi:hypothetical protein